MQTQPQLQGRIETRIRGVMAKVVPIVERVIAYFGGSPGEAARRIGVSKQSMNNWRKRGRVPRAYIKRVHDLTRIPLTDLINDA